jgi:hypothetical protein
MSEDIKPNSTEPRFTYMVDDILGFEYWQKQKVTCIRILNTSMYPLEIQRQVLNNPNQRILIKELKKCLTCSQVNIDHNPQIENVTLVKNSACVAITIHNEHRHFEYTSTLVDLSITSKPNKYLKYGKLYCLVCWLIEAQRCCCKGNNFVSKYCRVGNGVTFPYN